MKSTRSKKDGKFDTAVYRTSMQDIEFMQRYLDEPEIFNFGSVKFQEFLIDALANLHTDFHYLFFLNKEDIDQELKKVLGILQIYPLNSTRKSDKAFENWTESDIHKFWVKFFSLFLINRKKQFNVKSIFEAESQIEFFKKMDNTMQYLNYDFPIVNSKALMNINANDEVEKWDKICDNINQVSDITLNACVFDTHLKFSRNIEKLISDIKHILNSDTEIKADNKNLAPNFCDMIIHFNNVTNEVLKYNKHLMSLNSKIFSATDEKIDLEKFNKTNFLSSLAFLKKYNALNEMLKSKIKILY